jgi:methionine synthase II (cobalamin-independent)
VTETELPWPTGAATGTGSLPGTDPAEALRLVFGELPDLPYLPELPGRGAGAELVGRTAVLLTDLPVEIYAGRWRLASRPGRDLRRARDLLERDLDALTEVADGYTGPLKLQAGGPWTLAAGLDLPTGGPVLADRGATRDLAESLADGLVAHAAEVAARVPGARVLVQLDEPTLPTVLSGRVRTESGLGTFPPVEEQLAAQGLRTVIEALAGGVPVVVHCCAARPPVGLFREAGAVGVALDLGLVDLDSAAELDALGEVLDGGFGLIAGAVPTRPVAGVDPADSGPAAGLVRALWSRLGLPAARLPRQVVVSTACGLAGADPDYARTVLRTCREAARRLTDDAG